MLTIIMQQGIQEGVLKTAFPEQVGGIILSIGRAFQETIGHLVLSYKLDHETIQRIESVVAAYTDAIERVLGVAPAALCLIDAETLKKWVTSLRDDA